MESAANSSRGGVVQEIGNRTMYIISTSGRPSSMLRYRNLLQKICKLDIAYLPIHDGKDGPIDPKKYANILRSLPCIGGAISKDIKQTIIPYLDELDESAKLVNSVNTVIVIRNGDGGENLKGYNTDSLGFEAAIVQGTQKSTNVIVKRAVCYGYGGINHLII